MSTATNVHETSKHIMDDISNALKTEGIDYNTQSESEIVALTSDDNHIQSIISTLIPSSVQSVLIDIISAGSKTYIRKKCN